MMLFSESIFPYKGLTSLHLYQDLNETKVFLTDSGIPFREEVWAAESETTPNPWNVIVIENVMSLFFARNGKLFKIVLWESFDGSLPNGIGTGMDIEMAKKLDPQLIFDEWNEDYESPDGYWLEDDAESGRVISISIFIKELLDEDTFDRCNW